MTRLFYDKISQYFKSILVNSSVFVQFVQVIACGRVKLRFNFMRQIFAICDMQGKIYIKIIWYKHELRFECELQVKIRHACNCMSIKNTLYFTHKSLEVIYTNCGGGLYQIYKPKAKPSVYTSNINII